MRKLVGGLVIGWCAIGCGPSAREPGGLQTDSAATDDGGAIPDGPMAQPGVPAKIELYSGDGLIAMEGWPGGDEIKVIVVDGYDRPIADVDVAWDVVAGNLGVTGPFPTGLHGTSPTDGSGIARVGIRGELQSQVNSSWPSTVRASIAIGSVDIHALSTYYAANLPAAPPPAYVPTPAGRDLGSHPRDTVVPGAIVGHMVFQAGSEQGQGVPGVGMRLLASDQPSSDLVPAVSCANATVGVRSGGTVFTNAQGMASCDLKTPSAPGTYTFGVFIGGTTYFQPYQLTVE